MPQYKLEPNQIVTWSLPNSVTQKNRPKSVFYHQNTLYFEIFGSINLSGRTEKEKKGTKVVKNHVGPKTVFTQVYGMPWLEKWMAKNHYLM